ncbi:MAG: GtrA family protein [Frankiales bacterium]|nr:GtrA family protein [Frankiales bacterium]
MRYVSAPRAPAPELVRFAVTGLAAYATDVLVFNLLLLDGGATSTWAKVVSSLAAIAVAFAGSRYYTWPDRRSANPGREYALFLAFSLMAAGIQVLCLVVSHDLMGLTGALADNVSANIVGMGLATAFRFWTFRTYVFPPLPQHPHVVGQEAA